MRAVFSADADGDIAQGAVAGASLCQLAAALLRNDEGEAEEAFLVTDRECGAWPRSRDAHRANADPVVDGIREQEPCGFDLLERVSVHYQHQVAGALGAGKGEQVGDVDLGVGYSPRSCTMIRHLVSSYGAVWRGASGTDNSTSPLYLRL